MVDRRRHLPGLGRNGWRNHVVSGADVVALDAEPAVNQCVRLQRTHDAGEAMRAVAGHHARGVEPDQRHRSITGQQLSNLWLGLAAEVLVVVLLVVRRKVPGIAGAVRLVPVLRLRVVEPEADAAARAGVGQLLEDIALERRRVDDVVGTRLRLEEGIERVRN